MKMKDKIDQLRNPNAEIIDIDMMLKADKIVIKTIDGSTHTCSSEQIDIINGEIIQYTISRNNNSGRYIGKVVNCILTDAIILVQYIFNADK